MMRVGRALEQVFASVKMNFELLGNAVPHLHCQIKPRYYGDPASGIPIWPDAYPHDLAPEEYEKRVAAISAALAAQETTGHAYAGAGGEGVSTSSSATRDQRQTGLHGGR
jgi:hypothetical protein